MVRPRKIEVVHQLTQQGIFMACEIGFSAEEEAAEYIIQHATKPKPQARRWDFSPVSQDLQAVVWATP